MSLEVPRPFSGTTEPGVVPAPLGQPDSAILPTERFDSDRFMRATALADLLSISTSGHQAFRRSGGIPLVREILDAHLYDVSIGEDGEVKALVRQYQREHDSRFGQWHLGNTGHETVGIMEAVVDRFTDGNPYLEDDWSLRTRFLRGEALRVELIRYHSLQSRDGDPESLARREDQKRSSSEALAQIDQEIKEVLHR